MTQEEFDKLPLLLSPGQVRVVIGCDQKTVKVLRRIYPQLGVRLRGMKHWRYRKAIVAKLIGIVYK